MTGAGAGTGAERQNSKSFPGAFRGSPVVGMAVAAELAVVLALVCPFHFNFDPELLVLFDADGNIAGSADTEPVSNRKPWSRR